METPSDIRLITVRRLIDELGEFESECQDTEVTFELPGTGIFRVSDMELDKDGDLRLNLDQKAYDDGDCYIETIDYFSQDSYTVENLIFDLGYYEDNARVYLAGSGLYMNIILSGIEEGDLFSNDEDNEQVTCEVSSFGKYEEAYKKQEKERERDRQKEKEKTERKNKIERSAESIVLLLLTVLMSCGLAYNIMAIAHSDGASVLANIIWSVVLVILILISAAVIFFSMEK